MSNEKLSSLSMAVGFSHLSKSEDESSLKNLVKQIRELTECSEDEAITALYDTENSLERAIELLFDRCKSGSDEQWQVKTDKRSKAKPNEISKNSKITGENIGQSIERSRSIKPAKGEVKHPGYFRKNLVNNRMSNVSDINNRASIARAAQDKGIARERSDPQNWDPFKEYGDWAGECIEVINSNTEIGFDNLGDSFPPGLVDETTDSCPLSSDNLTSTTTQEANYQAEEVQKPLHYLKEPWTPAPPQAFDFLPDSPVFFVPGIVPPIPLKQPIKVGPVILHGTLSKESVVACVNSQSNQENAKESEVLVGCNKPEKSALNARVCVPTSNCLSQQSANSERPHEMELDRNLQHHSAIDSNFRDKRFHNQRLSEKDVDQLLCGAFKLKNLPNAMCKLSVADPQHNRQSFTMNQHGSQNKVGAANAQIQHNTEQNLDKGQPQQHSPQPTPGLSQHQSNPLPSGVPHFISQFAHPYQMFSLPPNSGNTSMIDLEQLQMLQQQQRLMYDMQLQQQAATTVQNQVTAIEAPPSNKHAVSSIPNTIGNVNSMNTAMRPDVIAHAMGHPANMMPLGHHYPYSGLFLMNGFPNPYLNQQQNAQDGPTSGHGVTTMAQQVGNQHSYQPVKQSVGSAYDELMDMKFAEHGKPVGFKDSMQQNYGSFAGQPHANDGSGQKIVGTTNSSGPQLTQGYSPAGGCQPQHFSQPYCHLPTAIAASAFMAAVSNHPNAGGTNVGNQNVNIVGQGQLHPVSAILGPDGLPHHPQRPGMQRQH